MVEEAQVLRALQRVEKAKQSAPPMPSWWQPMLSSARCSSRCATPTMRSCSVGRGTGKTHALKYLSLRTSGGAET